MHHSAVALNERRRHRTGVLSLRGRRVGALYMCGRHLAVSLCAHGGRHAGALGLRQARVNCVLDI